MIYDTPEAIVRTLAAQWMPSDRDYGNCLFCSLPDYDTRHEPTCPWLRAVEWVAAHRLTSGYP